MAFARVSEFQELPVDEKQMAKRKVAGRSCGGRVYLQEGGKKERDGGG